MIILITLILFTIILIYLLAKFIKNKNYKSIIIMFSVIIIIGLSYYIYIINKDYKIVYNGYISDFHNIIISDIDQYNEFMSDSDQWNKEYKKKISSFKYNESYFKNKSLALIFINTRSNSNTLISIDISTNNNILIVRPHIEYTPNITQILSGKLILVEIDKNIKNIEVII